MAEADDETPIPQKYAYADWVADCEWFFKTQQAAKQSGLTKFPMEAWGTHFEAKYKDAASFHRFRFQLAIEYFGRHLKFFDVGMIAVVGHAEGLVSTALIEALWQAYAVRPDAAWSAELPPARILEMARDNAARRKKTN